MAARHRKTTVPIRTRIRIDPISVILLAAMTVHLALHVTPVLVPELDTSHYWTMAVGVTVGLLSSMAIRALVAEWALKASGYRPAQVSVTVVGILVQPPARQTVGRAVMHWLIGSLVSLVLALVLLWAFADATGAGTPLAVSGIVLVLFGLNLIVLVVHTLPIFPLAGGQILHAALARWTGDFAKATRIAATVGYGLCGLLALGGIALAVIGWWGSGGWLAFGAGGVALAVFHSTHSTRKERSLS